MTDRAASLQALLKRAPYVQTLNMRCDIRGDEMTGIMRFDPRLIGNSAKNVLHGGAIGSFLEITAMAQVFLLGDLDTPPRPINLTIDYLRAGQAEDMYARAIVTKMGRRIANVQCAAWQSDREKPIASLRANFMLLPMETLPEK